MTRIEPDGTISTVAERFEGGRLNQPNDIAVRSDGTVDFTHPHFTGAEARADLDFHGVFRVPPTVV